ncbi:HPr(Ser) kinase/phosphatase [candidate division WOR-3 bacterium RBG_13_43_14]|uniref:HPr kinase/phosphorylase n=1 Tax=candidate division WOR-3 bacterium RBG_13_43_14 TaxID=1802590 RepID=A0A1F4U991_UNCW3|nr:MAG: HPr(Ser) kinase/phosphatase [candidate division WOR-3 bacterium RBG_13_43_14]
MNNITVETLYQEKKKDFAFELIHGAEYLKDSKLTTYDIFRPGLALAGYTGYFLSDRIMIIGKTETSFLKTLPLPVRDKRIKKVMKMGTPCMIVTKKLAVDRHFINEASKRKIPILRTKLSTTPFIHQLSIYLDYKLAPKLFVQGTLVDIYGVGVLFIGKPGTGKSECALDLVERGHRFVVDDLVKIVRRGDILIGSGAEKSERLRHHLEIRGVGLVDIFRIFGVKSVRLRKRIEVVVELMLWEEAKGQFDRIGLEKNYSKILALKIPRIVIPLTAGKNVSVIAEIVAMNYLLQIRGIHPANEYDKELMRVLAESALPSVHYDEDIE